MGRKVVLLIVDGCGAGQMPDVPDVRPSDVGACTLGNLSRKVGGLNLPNFERMGLGNIVDVLGVKNVGYKAIASFGKCKLKHSGADTYAGHQEIMGTNPLTPSLILFKEAADDIATTLTSHSYDVTRPVHDNSVLLVNGLVTVGDTIEGDPGLLYSVTAPLDFIPYEKVLEIGKVVRSAARISRVLTYGTKGITPEDIIKNIVTNKADQNGVSATALGLFNEHYVVRHLGYGVNPEGQVPTILRNEGFSVSLIGKTADLVECEGAFKDPTAETVKVLDLIKSRLKESSFVAGTVQETDLSGHEKAVERYARTLAAVDRELGEITDLLGPDDVLFVTADHGNDPTLPNTRRHTREYTPLLVRGEELKTVSLGVRDTLADIGATIADIFGIRRPDFGSSFWQEIH